MNYSVLMSVYYKENPIYFRAAIDSMLKQTVVTDDFVIVCDGPLGKDLDRVIDDFIVKYPVLFNIVRLDENIGLAKALNAGIVKCKNELVARMDSDDMAARDRIERQLKAMERENVDIVSGTVQEFEGDYTDVDKLLTSGNLSQRRVLPQTNEDIVKFAKRRSPFNHPAVMYKKSAVIDAGLYKDYRYFEDYNLWITMLSKGYLGYNIEDNLVYMRAGQDMYRRRGGVSYIRCIYRFNKHMKNIGFISTGEFVTGLVSRSLVSLIPNSIRIFIYSKLLRRQ